MKILDFRFLRFFSTFALIIVFGIFKEYIFSEDNFPLLTRLILQKYVSALYINIKGFHRLLLSARKIIISTFFKPME